MLYMVDYKLHRDLVRAVLNIGQETRIIALLNEYHKTQQIEIKRVRILNQEQKLLYVQYFDR